MAPWLEEYLNPDAVFQRARDYEKRTGRIICKTDEELREQIDEFSKMFRENYERSVSKVSEAGIKTD